MLRFLRTSLYRHPLHAGATLSIAIALGLGGCAATAAVSAATEAQAALPGQWHTPRPHGASVVGLSHWWQRFDDPLLVRLVTAAQEASPSIADAQSRIAQAVALRVGTNAALLPSVSATAGGSRGRSDVYQSVLTHASVGLQTAWEVDVFGGQRAAANAALARQQGAQAQWHGARVTVAAEVANAYTFLRACEAITAQLESDAASRAETARLTMRIVESGLQAPAVAALASASAAQGQMYLVQQKAACSIQTKSLVALTAIPEPELRTLLDTSHGNIPQAPAFSPDEVPAQALAQRPDLASAAQEVIAASADISASNAQRYPRITLGGSIGAMRVQAGQASNDGTVWSLGPIQLTLPIFDAGVRHANLQAAQTRHAAATASYRAALRTAVREVEQALVALHSTASRAQDAQAAADGFRASFVAVQARQRSGLASLFELEDARRSDVQAQTALIELQRDRSLAWIALYRALGGAWDTSAPVQTASIQP